ncbi:hypothetical protein GCM10022222_49940 [Amycolatopsis ultiminotia]|uniref:Uncharacterized protein n=1 Tax=Amycolatopsis ultiminotia TaxID=543629 RepID=A0ABP6X208_9PSEU
MVSGWIGRGERLGWVGLRSVGELAERGWSRAIGAGRCFLYAERAAAAKAEMAAETAAREQEKRWCRGS